MTGPVEHSEPVQQAIRTGADGLLGLGALSVPFWIQDIGGWVAIATAVLGLVLVAVRVLIAIREYRHKRKTLDV